MNDKIGGLLMGIVIDNNDPSGYKRVRVRIPSLHGSMTDSVYPDEQFKKASKVQDNAIPWATVCYPFGSDIPPEINQVVYVGFLSGDKNKPIVLGWLGYEYTNIESKVEPKVYTKSN